MNTISTARAESASSTMRPVLGSGLFSRKFRIVVITLSGLCSYFVLFLGIKTQNAEVSIDSLKSFFLRRVSTVTGFGTSSRMRGRATGSRAVRFQPYRRAGLRHTPGGNRQSKLVVMWRCWVKLLSR